VIEKIGWSDQPAITKQALKLLCKIKPKAPPNCWVAHGTAFIKVQFSFVIHALVLEEAPQADKVKPSNSIVLFKNVAESAKGSVKELRRGVLPRHAADTASRGRHSFPCLQSDSSLELGRWAGTLLGQKKEGGEIYSLTRKRKQIII